MKLHRKGQVRGFFLVLLLNCTSCWNNAVSKQFGLEKTRKINRLTLCNNLFLKAKIALAITSPLERNSCCCFFFFLVSSDIFNTRFLFTLVKTVFFTFFLSYQACFYFCRKGHPLNPSWSCIIQWCYFKGFTFILC